MLAEETFGSGKTTKREGDLLAQLARLAERTPDRVLRVRYSPETGELLVEARFGGSTTSTTYTGDDLPRLALFFANLMAMGEGAFVRGTLELWKACERPGQSPLALKLEWSGALSNFSIALLSVLDLLPTCPLCIQPWMQKPPSDLVAALEAHREDPEVPLAELLV